MGAFFLPRMISIMIPMGFTVIVEAPGAFEFMPLACTDTESDKDGNKGEAFHRSP